MRAARERLPRAADMTVTRACSGRGLVPPLMTLGSRVLRNGLVVADRPVNKELVAVWDLVLG